MRINLKMLVLITCVALLGIITLQVYWLFKAYEEQKSKLASDIDKIVLQTQIFTGVNPELNAAAKGLTKNILRTYDQKPAQPGISSKEKQILIENAALSDEKFKPELLRLIRSDSLKNKDYTLKSYKRILAYYLAEEGIKLPFEMTLLAPNQSIIDCTIDSNQFKKINFKTSVASPGLETILNSKQSGRIQLAFPNASLYLAKGMAIILCLSIVLVIVCCFSFVYMVTLFFRQKKIAEIRNDFMNNMTHELKTPISSVSVAIELLQDTSVKMPEDEKREYFKIATSELGRLTRLIDKVLRMAAFEKLQIKVRYESFNVSAWIAEGLKMVQPLINTENTKIIQSIEPGQLSFFADRNQFNSILQNLLENAIKYSDHQKKQKEISIEAREDGNNFYLKIRDNGIGIADQYKEKIFDKFFRIPTGNQHDIKGYGLGLSYVKEIVLLHKGVVKVSSKPQVGTTFEISFPKMC